MYNVLEKRRAGDRIEGKDKEIYDQGLIGILLDLHNQIDAAVADAYGWPATLTDDEILHRLVDLNRERALEESQGLIRWLRPDYQNPTGHAAKPMAEQSDMDLGAAPVATKAAWPKTLPEQMAAVQKALAGLGVATPEQVARQFTRARASSVQPMLDSLTALAQAHKSKAGGLQCELVKDMRPICAKFTICEQLWTKLPFVMICSANRRTLRKVTPWPKDQSSCAQTGTAKPGFGWRPAMMFWGLLSKQTALKT